MIFLVDKNERRRQLLEAALELEGLQPESQPDAAGEGTEILTDADHIERIIMMSPKAARRFRIRPLD